MDKEAFYQRIIRIATQTPYHRYGLLAQFHTDLVKQYLKEVQALTPNQAATAVSDGRPVKTTVGQIMGWERFTILALSEMAVGVRWPRIMDLTGYLETDGSSHNFKSRDEFNAYQTEKYTSVPWPEIQELALQTATALHAMFTQPAIISPDCLERTKNYEWRLPTGLKLTIPAGWYLWLIALEREVAGQTEFNQV